MKNKFLALALSLSIFLSFGVMTVSSQGVGGNSPSPGIGGNSPSPGIGGNSPCNSGAGVLPNPFKGGCSLYALLEAIIQNILLPIGAVLAVLAFIYSGFLYVTARGNTTKIQTAHRALLYSAIGTAILLGAWAIAKVIQNTIGNILNS